MFGFPKNGAQRPGRDFSTTGLARPGLLGLPVTCKVLEKEILRRGSGRHGLPARLPKAVFDAGQGVAKWLVWAPACSTAHA